MASKSHLTNLLALLALASVPVAAEEKGGKDSPPGDAAKAFLELSKPGPEHARLKMRVGNWKVAATIHMAPDAPPIKSTATASVRTILDGRYFREIYSGDFMGQKFGGIGMFGYDKGLKKYVSTWMDSMSTGVMRSEGTANESGDTITYLGKYFDPMRKKMVTLKYVLKLESSKTHTTTMFEVAEDGSEQKTAQLVYTRAPKQPGKGKAGAAKKKAK